MIKKITHKYYVGSKSALEANLHRSGTIWAKRTLEEAIAHAREMIEKNDSEYEFIVKVIKVVRRQKAPVIIEDVK